MYMGDTEAVPAVTLEFDEFQPDFSVLLLKIPNCCRVLESRGERKTYYGPHGVKDAMCCAGESMSEFTRRNWSMINWASSTALLIDVAISEDHHPSPSKSLAEAMPNLTPSLWLSSCSCCWSQLRCTASKAWQSIALWWDVR